jgi:hypothetical protein
MNNIDNQIAKNMLTILKNQFSFTNKKEVKKMRHKRLKLSAAVLLGLGLGGLQAQTMYVKENNGTQTTYALNNIQKMSFSSGNVIVTKSNNTNSVYALTDLMYLNFNDFFTNIEESLSFEKQMLSVYPNPVTNVLNINITGTVQEEATLIIFNFEGKAVLNRRVRKAGVLSLNIGHLPNGLYLCRYANVTETQTIKIIKQ